MAMPTHARLVAHYGELKHCSDAFFGPGAVRAAGRRMLATAGAAALLLGLGTASADWYVQDREAIKVLGKIRDSIGASPDNVNKNLDDLHQQQRVLGGTYNPEKDDKTKSKQAESPDHPDKATVGQRRCGGKLSPDQKSTCDAIVKLEQDRYKYLQDMRELSTRREQELRAIYEERQNIGEWELGKLQSNTNRLLALMAHQRIDQLNLQAGMSTFDDRVRVRKNQQTDHARGLMDPSKKGGGVGDIGGALAQQAVLAAALQVARQRER